MINSTIKREKENLLILLLKLYGVLIFKLLKNYKSILNSAPFPDFRIATERFNHRVRRTCSQSCSITRKTWDESFE